jgi:tetratricopeptide (TPR) repeat protein
MPIIDPGNGEVALPDTRDRALRRNLPPNGRLRTRARRSALLGPAAAALLGVLGAPVAGLVSPATAAAAQAPAGPVRIDGLGTIDFRVSATGEALDHFLRGVLLLHSFQYDDAAAAFREAQAVDPGFAMAYWGEAMTYTHPVWNEQDAAAARAALGRLAPTREARLAGAPTERERAWLEAVEILYGEGGKEARDTAYALAMERMAEAYPEDVEARAFHALALLGLSQGERDVPTYMRAGAIALTLLEEMPGHPGAAHYVIHAFDDPTHAPIGLRAARAYSRIAPDAAHAQHMTSHIFLARGMWEDVVAANERAMAVVNAERDGYAHCGHYNEWLAYGYQQQGRFDDALALVRGCLEAAADPELPEAARARRLASFASMRAWYLADSDASEGFPVVADVSAQPRAWSAAVYAFGGALAAARRGDLDGLRAAAESVTMARPDPGDWGYEYEPILLATLGALVLSLEGDLEGAAAAARRGAEAEAALPVDFGPPLSFKPPRELEGEILLRLGRPAEALEAFTLALGRTPNRAATVRGHALAAEAAGRVAGL